MNDNCFCPDVVGVDTIRQFGQPDAAALAEFVTSLDLSGLQVRFNRVVTPSTIEVHYRGLDWSTTIVIGWCVDGTVQALAEAFLHAGPEGSQAEIALCVHQDWRGRGIGHALLSKLVQAVARRGARRSVFVLTPGDCGTARIVRRLGGVIDAAGEFAIIRH